MTIVAISGIAQLGSTKLGILANGPRSASPGPRQGEMKRWSWREMARARAAPAHISGPGLGEMGWRGELDEALVEASGIRGERGWNPSPQR